MFYNVAQAGELSKINDVKLVHLLNDMEIVAEIKKPPLAVRVIRQLDHGECNGTPQSCPMQIMYIAVSTFDEKPDESVYMMPKAYGWEFLSWENVPDKEGRDYLVIFKMKRKIMSSTPEKGWWTDKELEVGVNPWKHYMKELQK
jgi:hypothetical protein